MSKCLGCLWWSSILLYGPYFLHPFIGWYTLELLPSPMPIILWFKLTFFLRVTTVSMFSYVRWTLSSLFGNPSIWILSPISNWLVFFWLNYGTIRPVLRCGLRNSFQSFKILFPYPSQVLLVYQIILHLHWSVSYSCNSQPQLTKIQPTHWRQQPR